MFKLINQAIKTLKLAIISIVKFFCIFKNALNENYLLFRIIKSVRVAAN